MKIQDVRVSKIYIITLEADLEKFVPITEYVSITMMISTSFYGVCKAFL